MNYIMLPGGIHLVLNGQPRAIARTDKVFPAVVEAIKAKANEDEILAILTAEEARLKAATQITPDINVTAGTVYYKGEAVGGVLAERMLKMLEEGFDLMPMANFLANLMQNPAKRVVDHLYAFLEEGKSPLTEDGCFLAYKAVREDYFDIHSGTFDNSIGAVVTMPRNRVDEDPDRTCSSGLHVCSYDYLPHFSHANGHVMICKVNPADVVAIPRDYNNTKMRVCRYEVIGEHDGYYKDEGDVLTSATVMDGSNLSNARFILYGYDAADCIVLTLPFATLVEASTALAEFGGHDDVMYLKLVNAKTDTLIETVDNPDYREDLYDYEDFTDELEDDNNPDDDDTFDSDDEMPGPFVIVRISSEGVIEGYFTDVWGVTKQFETVKEAASVAVDLPIPEGGSLAIRGEGTARDIRVFFV